MIGFGGVFALLLLLRVPSPYLGVDGDGRMQIEAWEREILDKNQNTYFSRDQRDKHKEVV